MDWPLRLQKTFPQADKNKKLKAKLKMALRKIVTLPEPVLRRKARTVTTFNKDLQTLIDDMIETLPHRR